MESGHLLCKVIASVIICKCSSSVTCSKVGICLSIRGRGLFEDRFVSFISFCSHVQYLRGSEEKELLQDAKAGRASSETELHWCGP